MLSLLANADVRGGGEPPGLSQLDLDLRTNGLPLDAFGALLGVELSGELFGSLRIDGLGKKPDVQGTLWVNDPRLDGYRQDQARWVIDADEASFMTQLELRQRGGGARVTATGPWRWGESLAPVLRPDQARLRLEANDFELRALRAALPEQVRALSGRLDAELAITPGGDQKATGNIQLREGVVHVAALGQEFHDIRLEATLKPSGAVQIEHLSGRALRGRVSATGQVELDGLSPSSARLVAEIPKSDPLPFMLEGVTVADAWGRINVDARAHLGAAREVRSVEVDIALPTLHVMLPEQAPHDVQQLKADPTVVTGTYRGPDHFLPLPLPPYSAGESTGEAAAPAPVAVRAQIDLGDDVWVERGTQLEVKLVGGLAVNVRESLSARGELRLPRGAIDVQGRIFEIERGVITFVEEREISNPTVVATARYTAPEGTNVYAEFVGPVESGTLSLRSEPPLRDDQILGLLLFGTPDGNFGASTGDGAASGTALAAGGSVVTRGLNHELRELTSLDIQTRIGEDEGQPQPEVVVQISPRLTAELAYSMRTPTPGRAQDRTYLTLDLRLLRNWSLSTTIGDAGSLLLDLLWRHRY